MNVYKITCSVNGKIYVGITKHSIEKRFQGHCKSAKRGSPNKIHNAMRKYGVENFSVELIETVETREEANLREMYWVSFYKSKESGYNMTEGGDSLWTSVEGRTYEDIYGIEGAQEQRKKRSSSMKKFIENCDSQEVRERLKNYHWKVLGLENTWSAPLLKGTNLPEDTKRKISSSLLEYHENISKEEYDALCERNSGERNPNFGNYWSQEQREAASRKFQERPVKKCPHCGYESRNIIIHRYHFDKCKKRKPE